ncbi:MAG: hypothetical protein R3B55_00580 [Candidatus Paceibacterota bacterium]
MSNSSKDERGDPNTSSFRSSFVFPDEKNKAIRAIKASTGSIQPVTFFILLGFGF